MLKRVMPVGDDRRDHCRIVEQQRDAHLLVDPLDFPLQFILTGGERATSPKLNRCSPLSITLLWLEPMSTGPKI